MKKADKLLISRAIFTSLGEKPFKGAVAINRNTITDVIKGDNYSEYIGETTEVYDCGDKLIMPGFMDGHVHFFMGATAASSHMCMDIEHSTSEEDCINIMKKFEKENPDEERLLGMGWFPANWGDASLPTKESTDKAFPDKAVYLISADVHTMWLNSKALEECNITKDTEVEFGEIGIGADGEPNGLLIELDAMGPALGVMFNFPKDVIREIYLDFIRQVSENGITSLGDMTPSVINDETKQLYKNVKALEDGGELNLRLHLYTGLMTDKSMSEEKKLREQYNSPKLQYSGLKGFLDGVTSTYTGFLLEPYEDRPDTCGSANYPKERYIDAVTAGNAQGLGVRLHCIADASTRWALDAFEESNKANHNEGNKKGLLNTIEHIENIHPDDLHRFAELGVIASIQPYHLTLDVDEKIKRIGLERCKYEFPLKSLLDNGATIALGTDYPVVNFNPFKNIYSAITRNDDDGKPTGVNQNEKISLSQALIGYTLGSAKAYGRQDELGTLEPGKLADIIVINKNLFDISQLDVKDCHVDMTIFDGDIVFQRK